MNIAIPFGTDELEWSGIADGEISMMIGLAVSTCDRQTYGHLATA